MKEEATQEQIRKIKSCLLTLAYAIEEGRIDGIADSITDAFRHTPKIFCEDCCDLEEGNVVIGHDHRFINPLK